MMMGNHRYNAAPTDEVDANLLTAGSTSEEEGPISSETPQRVVTVIDAAQNEIPLSLRTVDENHEINISPAVPINNDVCANDLAEKFTDTNRKLEQMKPVDKIVDDEHVTDAVDCHALVSVSDGENLVKCPTGIILEIADDTGAGDGVATEGKVFTEPAIELPDPTETRHFWHPDQYKLNSYELIAAHSAQVCCRYGCCSCCCCFCCCPEGGNGGRYEDYLEPGTIDYCFCLFPATCYYCWKYDVHCRCCVGISLFCDCFGNMLLGPLMILYHNVMRCCCKGNKRHRYFRVMSQSGLNADKVDQFDHNIYRDVYLLQTQISNGHKRTGENTCDGCGDCDGDCDC